MKPLPHLAKALAAATLSLVLSGCRHQPKVAALPPPPALPPVQMVTVPPPSHHTDELPAPPPAPVVAEAPVEKPKPPRRRRPAPVKDTQIAENTPAPLPAPAPSPIGQLSTAEDSNAEQRAHTESLLKSVQGRLSSVSSEIISAHHDQIEQVKLFLRQAEDAWKMNDVEGTRTLATKANVLLNDLMQ